MERVKRGKRLFRYYDSLEEALRKAYPQYPWDSSQFVAPERVPARYWQDKENLLAALTKAETKLGITKVSILIQLFISIYLFIIFIYPLCSLFISDFLGQKIEDWYSVRMTELQEVGFSTGASKKELASLLAEKYPDYPWDTVRLLKGRQAQQKLLEKAVATLFPVCILLSLPPPPNS